MSAEWRLLLNIQTMRGTRSSRLVANSLESARLTTANSMYASKTRSRLGKKETIVGLLALGCIASITLGILTVLGAPHKAKLQHSSHCLSPFLSNTSWTASVHKPWKFTFQARGIVCRLKWSVCVPLRRWDRINLDQFVVGLWERNLVGLLNKISATNMLHRLWQRTMIIDQIQIMFWECSTLSRHQRYD